MMLKVAEAAEGVLTEGVQCMGKIWSLVGVKERKTKGDWSV